MSQRRPNRFVSALRVLLGRDVTANQIAAEWYEYQQIFDDLLKRHSAQLARAAKAEKKRLERLQAQQEESGSPHPAERKLSLYRRAAQLGALPAPSQGNLALNHRDPSPQEECEECP